MQDLVEPRLLEPSTSEVMVKAITNGSEIAFRLEWLDESQSDMPGPRHFIDGCAVQLPSKVDPNVPAPQMGEVGKTVEISYWRADWQAIVEGRADNINAIYPNASIDHYPAEAQPLENNPQAQAEAAARYAPARALGSRRSGPREQPVEDLIAEGPSTLSPAPNAVSKGKGVKTPKGWGRCHLAAVTRWLLSRDAVPDRVCCLGRLPHRGWSKKDANRLGAVDLKVRTENMAVISDLMKVHKVIDELFFEHQRALLHFDFEKALGLLNAYESTLFSHMADEENILLPVYEKRADFPAAGAPKLYYDDHAKMRSHLGLFKQTIRDMQSEPELDRVLLQLLDREAFYLRLCSHHDRREADYLYPILDALLADEEKYEMLERVRLRGERH
ncbi:MAG: hypothetical protein IPG58_19680 [Acidobacteria bacterium]|nr:hypothetical protein [Acidobacteriota bacterium]